MTVKIKRLYWVDTAKAIGMFMVYYGHVVETMVNAGFQIAFGQFKFIYSFHMPLFFLIAGFFFRRRFPTKLADIKYLIYCRMIPLITFGLLTLPIWPVYMQLIFGRINWKEIAYKASRYLYGHPDLNTITWFIVCLFMVEVIAIFILGQAEKPLVSLLWAVVFLRYGLLMTANMAATIAIFKIPKNIWYIHEATVAFGLYALGYSAFETVKSLLRWKPLLRASLAVITLVLTLLTFNLNEPYPGFKVVMKTSNHGTGGLFLLTAILGLLSVVLIASLIPKNKLTDFIGRNTITLMAASGIFHAFINPYLVSRLNFQDSIITVTWVSLLITVISLALSLPFAWWLERYLPQFIGKPDRESGLFRALSSLKDPDDPAYDHLQIT
jgi:acyltransferase